jgi:hypothetical protein
VAVEAPRVWLSALQANVASSNKLTANDHLGFMAEL